MSEKSEAMRVKEREIENAFKTAGKRLTRECGHTHS